MCGHFPNFLTLSKNYSFLRKVEEILMKQPNCHTNRGTWHSNLCLHRLTNDCFPWTRNSWKMDAEVVNPRLPMASYTLQCHLGCGQTIPWLPGNGTVGLSVWEMCCCKWKQGRIYPAFPYSAFTQRPSQEKHLRETRMYYYSRRGNNTWTALTLQASQSETFDRMPAIQMTSAEKQKQACRCFP